MKIRGTARGVLRMLLDGGTDDYLTGSEGSQTAELPIDIQSKEWTWIEGGIRQTKDIHSVFFVYNGEGSIETAEFEIN